MSEINERRTRQRIMVEAAAVPAPGFELECDGVRRVVRDVSLEGFSMHVSTAPDSQREVAFRLQRADGNEVVSGRAQVVNYFRGATPDSGVAGCHVTAFDPGCQQRLADWLAAHVVAVAGVPLSEHEAREIVDGPSLV